METCDGQGREAGVGLHSRAQKGVFNSSLNVFDPRRLSQAGSDVYNKDEHLLSF